MAAELRGKFPKKAEVFRDTRMNLPRCNRSNMIKQLLNDPIFRKILPFWSHKYQLLIGKFGNPAGSGGK